MPTYARVGPGVEIESLFTSNVHLPPEDGLIEINIGGLTFGQYLSTHYWTGTEIAERSERPSDYHLWEKASKTWYLDVQRIRDEAYRNVEARAGRIMTGTTPFRVFQLIGYIDELATLRSKGNLTPPEQARFDDLSKVTTWIGEVMSEVKRANGLISNASDKAAAEAIVNSVRFPSLGVDL